MCDGTFTQFEQLHIASSSSAPLLPPPPQPATLHGDGAATVPAFALAGSLTAAKSNDADGGSRRQCAVAIVDLDGGADGLVVTVVADRRKDHGADDRDDRGDATMIGDAVDDATTIDDVPYPLSEAELERRERAQRVEFHLQLLQAGRVLVFTPVQWMTL